jgi:hypothetical protein
MAFYYDPPLWVGESAVDLKGKMADLATFRDVVFEVDLYVSLCLVRKARNDWIHSTKSPARTPLGLLRCANVCCGTLEA